MSKNVSGQLTISGQSFILWCTNICYPLTPTIVLMCIENVYCFCYLCDFSFNCTLLDISVISTVIYCISHSIILQISLTVNICNTLCIMGIFCDVRPHIQRLTVFFLKLLYTTVFGVTTSLAPFYWGCFIFLISYIWIDMICPTPCLQRRNSLGLTTLDVLHRL